MKKKVCKTILLYLIYNIILQDYLSIAKKLGFEFLESESKKNTSVKEINNTLLKNQTNRYLFIQIR